jgi:hypothetical protein
MSSEYMNTHAISFRMIKTPWSRVVWGPCLLWNVPVRRAAALAWPPLLWPIATALDATAARKSSAPGQLAGCAVGYRGVYSPLSIAAMPPVALVGWT